MNYSSIVNTVASYLTDFLSLLPAGKEVDTSLY